MGYGDTVDIQLAVLLKCSMCIRDIIFFYVIRGQTRSTPNKSSAASDVYKGQPKNIPIAELYFEESKHFVSAMTSAI